MTAIDLRDVRFSYHPNASPVLQGVSAAIRSGVVTALLGPNGVGKTTLLNVVLGWRRPSDGGVALFDTPAEHLSRRELGRTVSLLPQEEHIAFAFTVLEYVLLGRTPYLPPLSSPGPRDRDIALQALDRVDIAALAAVPVTEISGGERQLVLLARCLAQEPRILLMDEPTSHLDLRNKRQLVDLIRGLIADGTTVVFTTHDPEFAAVCADDLLLLRDGRCLAHGAVAETLTPSLLTETFGTPVTVGMAEGRPVVRW